MVQIQHRPFLRWAGGKNWLVPILLNALEDFSFNNYHELFLGGGSMFFALTPKKAYLSDINEDLIDAFLGLKDFPNETIAEIKKYKVSEENYYKVRKKRCKKPYTCAARFIYLNHTSFNGIYRVNSLGNYNVPYGHNDSYEFDYERITAAALALKKCETIIQNRDFEASTADIAEGDLVFIDPPYTVSHNNNGFIQYNRSLFSLNDQYRLKEAINLINKKGATYILTNAAHPEIKKIFLDDTNYCTALSRHCGLGGINAERGKKQEYIFSNCKKIIEGVRNGQ